MPAETIVPILAAAMLATGWALWLLRLGQLRATDARMSRVDIVPPCVACGRHHRNRGDHRT